MKHKKALVITLAVSTVLAAGLPACGKANKTNESPVAISASSTSAGLANPNTDVSSLEELSTKIDASIIRPEGVDLSNESYTLLKGDGDLTIGEYRFTANGKDYTLRVAKADPSIDISGVYEDGHTLYEKGYALSEDEPDDTTFFVQTGNYTAVRWFTSDGQYVLVTENKGNVDSTEFQALADQFMNAAPMNWNSSVPYESYDALKGAYLNEDGTMVGIDMSDTHVTVSAIGSCEDGNLYWKAECELKGDQLVYESATVDFNVYDENTCETTTTHLDGEGAGSIQVNDGSLIFNGCSTAFLKDKVFEAYEM
ncbi:MAG: hypothetical protein MJ117_11260 [Lachnospiraceae bacterium]|nr:hypothetical protein [Lachnospiraceae bacterium]